MHPFATSKTFFHPGIKTKYSDRYIDCNDALVGQEGLGISFPVLPPLDLPNKRSVTGSLAALVRRTTKE